MSGWLRWTLAALLLVSGTESRAASIPDWAIGRWIAVASVESAGFLGFGENYLNALPMSFSETQLDVSPSYIAESFSPYNLKFVWGVGVTATVGLTPLPTVLQNVSDPYVYGEKLTYDPAQPVLTARLTMETCAEDGGRFESQVTTPLYRFAKLRTSCRDYSLFRFPDDRHVAMWRRGVAGGNSGLVVFKRFVLSDH